MSYAEIIRVGLFLMVLAAIPVFDVYLVFRYFARANAAGPDGNPPPPKLLDELWMKVLAAAVTLLVIICAAYARFVEPGWVVTEEVTLTTDEIPKDEKFRIVFLADLHLESGSRIAETAAAASMLSPDIILLGGDYMNADTRSNRKMLFEFCEKLKAREGVFAVGGNWDHDTTWSTMVGRAGVEVIEGTTRTFRAGRGRIALCGLAYGDPRPLKDFAEKYRESYYTIVLHHSPDILDPVFEAQVDLLLSGHTHGGQLRLPLYGALVTLSRYGKRYEGGLYHEGPTTLYVTRGLGCEGGWVPRIRFCCRPEVTVIDLVGTGK